MNLRDLEYFVAISEHKHFGNAAKATFVSQPALSMQIKKLENFLGVQLIERTNQSVLLTEIGQGVLLKAKDILASVTHIKEMAALSKDPDQGEMKIGIIPTLAPYLLPLIMQDITLLLPKLTLYLIEEQTGMLMDKLSQGKLDAVILALPLAQNNLIQTKLFEEEFKLAVPIKHRLAKQKTFHEKDLADKNLYLLEEGHCLRDQALSFCKKINANESQVFRATSLETLRHMVASGMGFTLMPALACKVNDDNAYLSFANSKPSRLIGMVWRAGSVKTTLFTKLADCIRKTMSVKKLVTIKS